MVHHTELISLAIVRFIYTCHFKRVPAQSALLTVMVLSWLLSACGSSGGGDGSPGGVGTHVPAPEPTVGEHALVYQRITNSGSPVVDTPAMSTMSSGSTMVISVGRGDILAFESPTDNLGGVYAPVDAVHPYTMWQRSGTALYTRTSGSGGAGHVVSNNTPVNDEITLAVVEVYGGPIESWVWNEVLEGNPLTSGTVTTAGSATLVAFWWGDADAPGDKTAVPNGGFTVIDSILEEGMLVQCAVAVRHVDAAGTYDVTWTATPTQGAQMWLVAVPD